MADPDKLRSPEQHLRDRGRKRGRFVPGLPCECRGHCGRDHGGQCGATHFQLTSRIGDPPADLYICAACRRQAVANGIPLE